MTDPWQQHPPNPNRRVIPVHCTQHGGTPGFTNLVVRKIDGRIELDPHAARSCVLTLDENAATALHETLGEWLG